jgi:phosphatidate cytidylyltransferase
MTAEHQHQPASSGRAGRDLVSATGVGALLGVFLVLLPVLYAPWVFALVVAAAMVLGSHELRGALATRGVDLVWQPLYVGVAAVSLTAYWFGALAFIAVFAATVLLVLGWRLLGGPEGYVADVSATIMAAAYTGLMAGFVG